MRVSRLALRFLKGPVGLSLGLLIAFLAWRYPVLHEVTVQGRAETAVHAEPTRPATPAPFAVPQDDRSVESRGPVLGEKRQPIREEPLEPDFPVEFTLKGGEQRVLLGGRMGLAIDFNRVGAKEFLTLHISVAGEPAKHYAVLSGGGRYEFRAGGETYVASVLRWDAQAQDAAMRVDRKS